MSAIDSIITPIKKEILDFQPYFKSYIKSKASLLNIIINYILKHKGKQMRPMLVFLSAKMLGSINESTYHATALIELMHTATLVHDDIVDNSDKRRGFFSINALWKNKISVLLGDYLLAKGLLLAVNENEFELLKIVSKAVEEMSEGELIQIEKARKLDIDEQTYFNIINKKTAALMIACSTAGAKSVNADNETIEKMAKFGEYLGLAFQIRDDLFDYDNNNSTGKPFGNDIIERKMTLPLIYALTKCDKKEKRAIIKMIRKKDKSTQMVSDIIKFTYKYDGITYAKDIMNEYKAKAINILSELPQNDSNTALLELLEYTTTREK